jgi:hypothetical protein
MPKKREVASFTGNFSPVKRRRAILVRRIRHLRGETGDVLKTRAVVVRVRGLNGGLSMVWRRAFLVDRHAIHLQDRVVVLVLFILRHPDSRLR